MQSGHKRVSTVKDVPAAEFIKALATHFKNTEKIKLPSWHQIVKTGPLKELPPRDPDWFYVRTASVARKVYLNGGKGIGAMARSYGGRYRRGTLTEHHADGARGLIRHSLKELERIGLVAKAHRGDQEHGRKITSAGKRELDTIASELAEKQFA